jgi:hypothetical protein
MHEPEKRQQEYEKNHLEVDAEANAKVESFDEQVNQLNSLEERSSPMEQQACPVEAFMAQMMSYMTPRASIRHTRAAQSNSNH